MDWNDFEMKPNIMTNLKLRHEISSTIFLILNDFSKHKFPCNDENFHRRPKFFEVEKLPKHNWII